MTPKNWPLNSYTDATWTDLVDEAAIVAAVLISNIGSNEVTVEIRLYDTSSALATILPPAVLSPNEAATLDTRSMCVTGTQVIQVRADIAGAEFLASGVV